MLRLLETEPLHARSSMWPDLWIMNQSVTLRQSLLQAFSPSSPFFFSMWGRIYPPPPGLTVHLWFTVGATAASAAAAAAEFISMRQ